MMHGDAERSPEWTLAELAGGRDSNPSHRQAGCGFPGFCDQKATKRNTNFFCDLWMNAYDCQLVDLRFQRVHDGGQPGGFGLTFAA